MATDPTFTPHCTSCQLSPLGLKHARCCHCLWQPATCIKADTYSPHKVLFCSLFPLNILASSLFIAISGSLLVVSFSPLGTRSLQWILWPDESPVTLLDQPCFSSRVSVPRSPGLIPVTLITFLVPTLVHASPTETMYYVLSHHNWSSAVSAAWHLHPSTILLGQVGFQSLQGCRVLVGTIVSKALWPPWPPKMGSCTMCFHWTVATEVKTVDNSEAQQARPHTNLHSPHPTQTIGWGGWHFSNLL